MYSYYVLHQSTMLSAGGDAMSDIFVLSDRDDLLRALDSLKGDSRNPNPHVLRVYQHGRLTFTADLKTVNDDACVERPALGTAGLAVPPLEGTPLPPGHPVQVDGAALAYGYTARCN